MSDWTDAMIDGLVEMDRDRAIDEFNGDRDPDDLEEYNRNEAEDYKDE